MGIENERRSRRANLLRRAIETFRREKLPPANSEKEAEEKRRRATGFGRIWHSRPKTPETNPPTQSIRGIQKKRKLHHPYGMDVATEPNDSPRRAVEGTEFGKVVSQPRRNWFEVHIFRRQTQKDIFGEEKSVDVKVGKEEVGGEQKRFW